MEGLFSFQPYSRAAYSNLLVTEKEGKVSSLGQTYLLDEHEALGVGDDLGGVQGLLEVIDESLLVTGELGGRAVEKAAGTDTLVLEGRQAAREDSLADQSDGHAKVKGVDGSPLAGTLLTSLVEDLLDEGSAVVVVEVKDVTGDLNQERVQNTLVPLGEHIGNLLGGETQTTLEDVVGLLTSVLVSIYIHPIVVWSQAYLADQLHVTVLNTVVDHLDEVTSALVTNPVAAGLAVALGGDALEDVLDVGPGLLVTTGHERGAVTGTLLTTGDTAADEADALLGEVLGAAVAVGEVGVTTVNDDITLLKVGQERLDELVNGLSSHDQEHDTTGALQLGAELLNGVGTDDGLA